MGICLWVPLRIDQDPDLVTVIINCASMEFLRAVLVQKGLPEAIWKRISIDDPELADSLVAFSVFPVAVFVATSLPAEL